MNSGCVFLRLPVFILFVLLIFSSGTAVAQYKPVEVPAPSNYGGVGLLDTRTARFFPDGYLVVTASFSEPDDRYALTFQALPWAEVTFRYSINRGIPDADHSLHDRSFDVKIRLANESEYFPQVAVGLQDILGTGVYSGEYLVGSKRWGPFDFSLGLGWGRLASRGTFQNPFIIFGDHFRTRPDFFTQGALGGVPLFNSYFRGPDMGLFAGVQYDTPIENVVLKLEYSSDIYVQEKLGAGRDYDYPINVGISYRPWSWLDVGVSLLHGRIIGLRISTVIDPTAEIWPVRLDPAPRFRARPEEPAATILQPQPARASGKDSSAVQTRFVDLTQPTAVPAELAKPSGLNQPDGMSASTGTVARPSQPGTLPQTAADILAPIRAAIDTQKVSVMGLSLEGDKAVVLIENARYARDVEAVARVARALSGSAPANIEYFEITTTRAGLPIATITLPRTQIDKLARNEGSPAELLHTSDVSPASSSTLQHVQPGLYPAFSLSGYPIFRQSLFDPDNPFYVQFGLGAAAAVRLTPNLFIDAAVAQSLYDDFNDIKRTSNSVLPHVRSDFADYLKEGKFRIEALVATHTFKINPEIFARVSAGYIEWMYAGAGGEVLYRPFGRRWSLGADVWAVRQREFDGLFGLRRYQTITGHVSAYYDLPWYDIQLEVDAGRYLAGDRGVTFQATRRFSTGVQIGAWFTLTNVSAEQFGEGSFDKGIRIYIPFEWSAPFATRSGYDLQVRSIQRDGGQQLLGNRILHQTTESSDYGQISQYWSSVFK